METILVTGDIVLDCHLYGGVKTAATSFREPGTVYAEHLGGAALTHELVAAAADAKGLAWDDKKKKWDEENRRRLQNGKAALPRPDDLAEDRPSPIFATRLDIDTQRLKSTLPGHLRSYGVWTEQPARKGAKDRVWRVERHFGYGPTVPLTQGNTFKRNPIQSATAPILTLIDDGGILFRHRTSQSAWPELSTKAGCQYLLKMSSPLCRSDLWAELAPVMEQLIVVVAAVDLRCEDTQINARLSWEQCAQDTMRALQSDPIARDLLRAAHVVVSFRSAGALWVERGQDDQSPTHHLLFDPTMLEGDYSLRFDGTAYGFQTCLTAGIAHHLMQIGRAHV